jgi:hypothetical protein
VIIRQLESHPTLADEARFHAPFVIAATAIALIFLVFVL